MTVKVPAGHNEVHRRFHIVLVVAVDRSVDADLATANLAVALRLADLLRADGYDVRLMRTDDGAVRLSEAASLQARADRANEAGADLFISVHHNGSDNRTLRGTEVYYCAHRSFGDDNRRLAQAVLDGIVRNLRQAGYDTPN
ncbi:MAG: N-acetylmuramoyl-L-alanine amidase, partial [Alicyclobacillus sp.]|nr:N-acetylmuramoyl-L-alanine amidase [Alicyclobacillus sp.]